ncbi:MAG: DciA family protein [Candidatus Moraniibacteriota bacterium]
MRTLSSFISNKKLTKPTAIDQQSVFYVFDLIVKEQYGTQGEENVKPVFFKDKKIFVKATGSIWASEIWLKRGLLVRKINEKLGGEEISELVMNQ